MRLRGYGRSCAPTQLWADLLTAACGVFRDGRAAGGGGRRPPARHEKAGWALVPELCPSGFPHLLRIDDEAEGAAERRDSVAVAHGRERAVRQRRELLIAEQVQRLAVPGNLREVPPDADLADTGGRHAPVARCDHGEHRGPGTPAGGRGRAPRSVPVAAEGVNREVDKAENGLVGLREHGLAADRGRGEGPGPWHRLAASGHQPPDPVPGQQARLEIALAADRARRLVEQVQRVPGVGDLPPDALAVDAAEQPLADAGAGDRLAVGGDSRPFSVVVIRRPGAGGTRRRARKVEYNGGAAVLRRLVRADEVQRVVLVRPGAYGQRPAERRVGQDDLGAAWLGM